jgi:hypothetical protein
MVEGFWSGENKEYLSWIRVAEELQICGPVFPPRRNYFWLIRDKGDFGTFAMGTP